MVYIIMKKIIDCYNFRYIMGCHQNLTAIDITINNHIYGIAHY